MPKRKSGERDFRDLVSPTEKRHRDDRKDNESAGDSTRDWWNQRGEKCAGAVNSTVQILQKAQTPRMRQQVINARLYGNLSLGGAAGSAYARIQLSNAVAKERITYNATQECIDSIGARVGETKPRPYFLTSGGSYRQQRKAKKLNQFIEGTFYEQKTYDVGADAFRDAEIFGDGFVFVFGQGGRVIHERVQPSELWVDEIEGQYGFPRNMHRLKVVDKDQLCGAFPTKAAEIRKTSKAVEPGMGVAQSVSDMVTVVESWHLATQDEEGKFQGGKHCISLPASGVMLLEPEDYPYDFFPFARLPWCKRPLGYYSQGLCEQLQGDQIELNKELWLIQRSMHLAGSFKVLLKNGSKVSKEHINNDVGAIINWSGETKPEYIIPAPIHPVYFENVDRIIQRMRARAGVNEMTTSGRKPAGIDSGKALREVEDIQSDRFRTIQRLNDQLYMQIAMLSIVVAAEMSKAGKLKNVRVPGKHAFSTVDWKKDIKDVKTDEFVLQAFPVSRLPRDPSGRLATIQEYIQAGFITPRQGRRALDFPDIDSIESLANANEDLLTKNLDAIIDADEEKDLDYQPPEPTDDLELAKEMVLEYIQRYRLLDTEDWKLDQLRTYNSQIDALQKMAAQQMQAQQAAMMPQAAPEAPPTSNLIPNAPAAAA